MSSTIAGFQAIEAEVMRALESAVAFAGDKPAAAARAGNRRRVCSLR